MWSIVQQRVYQSRVHNSDEMKQRLLHVWQTIMQLTSGAGRLRACVWAKDGQYSSI